MNLMLELPGGKYFAVPREVLAKYSVTKAAFEAELAEKQKNGTTVFHEQAEVEGQEAPRPRPPRTSPEYVPFGVRG